VIWDYRNGDLIDQTPTSGAFTEGEGERLISQRLEIQSIQTSSLGGDFTLGDWQLGASISYGEAKQKTPYDREWSFETDDDRPMTYDTSRKFFSVDAGPDFHRASEYEFNEYARGGQLVEEEVRSGQLDLQRSFQIGGNAATLKFGGKQVARDKTSDQEMVVYDAFDDDLLMTAFAAPGKSNFYSSERRYEYGPRIDYGAVESFFRANETGFEPNAADTVAESFGVDYTITEDVTAGYVMSTVEIGNAVLIGGVRMERTESEFTAFDIAFDDGDVAAAPTAVRGAKNYSNWLPGLQARFNIADNLIARAAWTNTIGRPSYETTVPFRVFDTEPDGEDAFEGEIETGNPDLDPLESMNLDASFEWYLPAGIVSAGVFYKDIENPIFTRFTVLEDVQFEGRFFTDLTITRPENADSGRILGLELNFQQQFRDLPYPFDGLGLGVNYTYSDSESSVFDRADKLPFFLQSEHVGNIAVFYEKRGLELRLAYSYRSEYLDTLGEDQETDLWVDAYGQLDFKSSYEFSRHFTTFLQVQNITNESLRLLSGSRRRLAENEIYSWNALVGVQIKF
jgi:TonB-dependent receptor